MSNNIACKRRIDLEVPDIESLWIEIRAVNKIFLLCIIYRAESNTDNSFWDKLQENIDLAYSQERNKILILGDINADPMSQHGNKLIELSDSNNM